MLNSASTKQIVAAVSIRRTEGEIQHIAEAATAIVPVRVHPHSRNVPHIAVLIQRLRITEISVRDWHRYGAPVGCDESSQTVRVIPCPEVIEASFRIAFFARELVVVGIVVGELKLAAPGIII